MNEQPRRKVTLQHPTQAWLQVVVWEGTLADTLRRLEYTDVPADELPEVISNQKEEDDGNDDDSANSM